MPWSAGRVQRIGHGQPARSLEAPCLRSFMAQCKELKGSSQWQLFGAPQCLRPRPRGSLEADPATLPLGCKKDRTRPRLVSFEVACRAPGRDRDFGRGRRLRDPSRKRSLKRHWAEGWSCTHLPACYDGRRLGCFCSPIEHSIQSCSKLQSGFRGCPQGHQAQTPGVSQSTALHRT